MSVAARMKRLRVGDLLIRRNPLWYGRALRRFDALERAALDERRAWTERRLAKVLAAARETEWGQRVGAPRSLHDWPVLDKEEIRDDPDAFVRGSKRVAATAETSGTSGLPLSVWRSFESVVVEQAAIDRLLHRFDVDARDYRAAILRGDDIKDPADRTPPFWLVAGGGRKLVFSSNHLSHETVGAFADVLARFKPTVLHAYPTILESLCLLLQEAGRIVRIPMTVCSSETLAETTWQLAVTTLSTRVVDYYGLAERVSVAYAYSPHEYRFLPGYAYNELLPYARDEDPETYELVATGLWNMKMPLVRFRTGDLIRVSGRVNLDEISYGVAPFRGILGRTGDYLVAPDGARLMGIDHIPRGVKNVLRTQVIQERPDLVRVLVRPTSGFGDADRAAILANAAKKLPPPIQVSLDVESDLERTAAGKVPFVIRRMESRTEK
jgi:phenylacetate-CoA ligase